MLTRSLVAVPLAVAAESDTPDAERAIEPRIVRRCAEEERADVFLVCE
jgi:hypothetical protein